MTYMILTEECIDCRLCIPECPDGGITRDEETGKYSIDKNSCTECIEVGYSQCANVCPVDCIVIDSNHPETRETLLQKVEKNKKNIKSMFHND